MLTNKKYIGSEITEIYKNIKFVVLQYLKFGANEFVLDWVEGIRKWGAKNLDNQLIELASDFLLWKDKESLKLLIAGVRERNQGYLNSKALSLNVFIAHSDGDPFVQELVALLIELGFKPIVMQKIPSQGDTIFHKFKEMRFGLAIIMLTKDYRETEETTTNQCRPNVLVETGYCYGHLKDPSSVVILHDGAVEIPSNIGSVEYIKTDKDWKYNLIKSLKARGLID